MISFLNFNISIIGPVNLVKILLPKKCSARKDFLMAPPPKNCGMAFWGFTKKNNNKKIKIENKISTSSFDTPTMSCYEGCHSVFLYIWVVIRFFYSLSLLLHILCHKELTDARISIFVFLIYLPSLLWFLIILKNCPSMKTKFYLCYYPIRW